jgi:hypothetical protein
VELQAGGRARAEAGEGGAGRAQPAGGQVAAG